MKKIIILLCILLLVFSLVSCKQKSPEFSEKEIESAIEVVKNDFDFPASTLTEVWYDEEKADTMRKGYLENGRGSENKIKAENVIVLLSNFDVGDSVGGGLNPNSTYTDFNWILIRDDKVSDWKIDDKGY